MTTAYEWLAEASLWWWPRFADHLWQTTLFALVVLVASLALRRSPARSRHNFWLVASAKFVIPAAFFVFFAQQAGVHSLPFFSNPPAAEQDALALSDVTQPASTLAFNYEVTVAATPPGTTPNETTPNDHREIYLALTALWLAGCLTLFSFWAVRRRTFLRSLKLGSSVRSGREWQILVRARETLHLKQDVGLVLSPLKIEPAVWRVWRPVVVMPDSIGNQLDDQELESIMLHELVHIQRRDNLIGNLQFVLCSLLWFHPLVWFISRKIFDEREQACDESVMEVCKAPEAYASSILKVVRFCFGWRVEGVAGAASGSNLRRRIENIMTIGNTKRRAGRASRLMAGALVATALVVLVCAGVYSEARGINGKPGEVRAQSLEATAVNVAEIISSGPARAASSELQKRRLPLPPPPEPLQPSQPPQPDQAPQPAQAPQPSAVPQPGHAPQPAQAPQPDQGPQPSGMPAPSQPPQPAQAPKPGQAPHPSQAPPPPPPAAVGAGSGSGPGTGVGRAVGGGRGIGSGGGRASGSSSGHGIGTGVGPVPASARSRMPAPPTPASAPTLPPPPPPAKRQQRNQKSKDKADRGALIEAPNPVYPVEAREQKIQGTVRVDIVVDEEGKVISAKAKSGPEMLYGVSQEAAYKARFKPAIVNGKPTEVAAALSYNFIIVRNRD